MKKLIIIAVALIAMILPDQSKAVSYRGFFDFGGTFNLANDLGGGFADVQFTTTHGVQILPMFYAGIGTGLILNIPNNSKGLKKQIFEFSTRDEGLGFIDSDFYNLWRKEIVVTTPIYLDLRWDAFSLFKGKSVVPFIDLKIGYSININYNNHPEINRNYILNYADFDFLSSYIDSGKSEITYLKNGLFFQPTAGVRFRISRMAGFNIGLTYRLLPGGALTGITSGTHTVIEEWGDTFSGYDITYLRGKGIKSKPRSSLGIIFSFDF